MIIPYQYNKMGAGGVVTGPNPKRYERGVFTFLSNGSCNQSGMTIRNAYLTYSRTSRMEVFSDGIAMNATVNNGGRCLFQTAAPRLEPRLTQTDIFMCRAERYAWLRH